MYRLFDRDRNEITYRDLQNKGAWCRKGFSKEEVFVALYGPQLNIVLNPAKTKDPYAVDLLDKGTSKLADLKTQNTPFFQARSRYDIDPQCAVVFNIKDEERYENLYPDIDILFWVDWQVVHFEMNNEKIDIKPMIGVWKIGFQQLRKLCAASPIHRYQQRINDLRGNAKRSYVLNLFDKAFEKVA